MTKRSSSLVVGVWGEILLYSTFTSSIIIWSWATLYTHPYFVHEFIFSVCEESLFSYRHRELSCPVNHLHGGGVQICNEPAEQPFGHQIQAPGLHIQKLTFKWLFTFYPNKNSADASLNMRVCFSSDLAQFKCARTQAHSQPWPPYCSTVGMQTRSKVRSVSIMCSCIILNLCNSI